MSVYNTPVRSRLEDPPQDVPRRIVARYIATLSKIGRILVRKHEEWILGIYI